MAVLVIGTAILFQNCGPVWDRQTQSSHGQSIDLPPGDPATEEPRPGTGTLLSFAVRDSFCTDGAPSYLINWNPEDHTFMTVIQNCVVDARLINSGEITWIVDGKSLRFDERVYELIEP